jgi:thermitase
MARILVLLVAVFISFQANANSSFVNNQLIVKFKSNSLSKMEMDKIHSAIGAKADIDRRGKLLIGMDLVMLPENLSVADAIKYYSGDKLKSVVEYVQPNYIGGNTTGWPVTKPMTEENLISFFNEHSSKSDATDDPMFGDQWALLNSLHSDINILTAWEQSKGSSEIIVAVVDTGIDYLHKDLINNVWINKDEIPSDGIDNDGNGYIDDYHGYNILHRNAEVMDEIGHGTHVSGTIGAVTNNNLGIAGINWDVQIMALRAVPNSGDETDADVIESFLYAANNGARVINCSFGKYESGTAVQDTINEIGKLGVLVVAAAGNSGENVDKIPSYPAAFDSTNLITVAATRINDELIWWSNYGNETVDIAAPGVDIVSTVPDNFYSFYSGTSMATPHVSGAAALLLSINSNISAEELKDLLMRSSSKLEGLDGYVKSGGRLNVGAAASAFLDDITP